MQNKVSRKREHERPRELFFWFTDDSVGGADEFRRGHQRCYLAKSTIVLLGSWHDDEGDDDDEWEEGEEDERRMTNGTLMDSNLFKFSPCPGSKLQSSHLPHPLVFSCSVFLRSLLLYSLVFDLFFGEIP